MGRGSPARVGSCGERRKSGGRRSITRTRRAIAPPHRRPRSLSTSRCPSSSRVAGQPVDNAEKRGGWLARVSARRVCRSTPGSRLVRCPPSLLLRLAPAVPIAGRNHATITVPRQPSAENAECGDEPGCGTVLRQSTRIRPVPRRSRPLGHPPTPMWPCGILTALSSKTCSAYRRTKAREGAQAHNDDVAPAIYPCRLSSAQETRRRRWRTTAIARRRR
ncbi:hypothetical protein C8R47DRAFT_170706 [Mycena vitilis]|nr:hypothetical protein C8R47DRAFT_170706 [Mycena vitilis]